MTERINREKTEQQEKRVKEIRQNKMERREKIGLEGRKEGRMKEDGEIQKKRKKKLKKKQSKIICE